MNRCDETCRYPCAKDHRTKAEKIAAMAAGATTPGEKAAAEAAMAKHPVKEQQPVKKPVYFGHTKTYSSNAARGTVHDWTTWYMNKEWTEPTPEEARPSGAKARGAYYDDIIREAKEYEKALGEELLRRYQAEETLRSHGFTMPGDPEFEAGFVPRPESTNARRAREQFDTLHQMFREGKIKPDKAKRPKEE